MLAELTPYFSREASETAAALRDIIAGRIRDFRMEYPCASSRGQRWFQARITRPEQDGSQRIVVAHEDITEVKEAHEELARLTARVMHFQEPPCFYPERNANPRARLRSGTPPTDRALARVVLICGPHLPAGIGIILRPPSKSLYDGPACLPLLRQDPHCS